VVASAYDGEFGRARAILRRFGDVRSTGFRNVLLLEVEEPGEFLARFSELAGRDSDVLTAVSRVRPATRTFHFDLPEEFEARAREIALEWVPELAGKSFHVRLHRRGFKGRLVSPEEERFLDRVLLEALEAAGAAGSITFEDPDAIIDIETVGNWAGMSLWTREELHRYPFLRVD
jgi:tRNA(Ser,Leu) C12 N-acetylase TAN1